MKTMNEMIVATLRTKNDAKPKYYFELTEAGYQLERGYDYWAVNGFQVHKPEGEKAYYYLHGVLYEGFDVLKKIDFVNYFATYEDRESRKAARQVTDKYEAVWNTGWRGNYVNRRVYEFYYITDEINSNAKWERRQVERDMEGIADALERLHKFEDDLARHSKELNKELERIEQLKAKKAAMLRKN